MYANPGKVSAVRPTHGRSDFPWDLHFILFYVSWFCTGGVGVEVLKVEDIDTVFGRLEKETHTKRIRHKQETVKTSARRRRNPCFASAYFVLRFSIFRFIVRDCSL